MARVLAHNVLVRHPDGRSVVLAEGGEVPDWANGQVGDHVLAGDTSKASAGSRSQAASTAADAARDAAATAVAAAQVAATGAPDGPPPQSGAGSARGAWARYATANGVTVAADDTRDEIVAACEKAGVRTN